ncbi:protein C3orf33 homolog [Sabethes cyaneus]|uniref:protein C3orf33 homolog n=1 Tax=Sabethes cyaneus TaxID=53552 RepID=UPI00221E34C5|nr:protein C3orf33 homolog [Sabethes cyaneus]XP_053697109.1 protein C3orf33 homolog [Sabethes cyaneus]XP_053697116.1 protein C3orf33 homolog [Sabethes cyaneus]
MAVESPVVDSYFQQFCDYMKRDTRGVEIATYTISGVLFAVAYNKIRPLTRFGKPSDIPKHFIREQIPQYGRVQKIEPTIQSGPLLIVKHRPPLNLFFWSSKTLPVRVAGIDINANGYSWLQSVVVDRKVTFLPIQASSSKEFAECSVYFQELSSDRKWHRKVDVAQALLNLGFAKLTVPVPRGKIDSKDVFERKIQAYFRTLARSENTAKERRIGLWQQTLPPKLWPVKLWQNALDGLALRIMPKTHRLPELVR